MTDFNALKAMLTEAVSAGALPPDFLEKFDTAAQDPRGMDSLINELTALMGDQAEAPLTIADFYREGNGSKYTMRWPLSPANPLPAGLTFATLDRKTQFFVLFAECQRREAEGMFALNQGNLAAAEEAFKECVERADQIEVGELRARNLENLARLAEKKGLAKDALVFLRQAEEARKAGIARA